MAMLNLRLRLHGKPRALRCHRCRAARGWPHGMRRSHPTAVGVVFHATAVAGAVETRIAVLVPQALLLARAPHALRWRLETFGLYMPSLPEARPWWRPSLRAMRALCRQLPGYARWLAEMQVLRHAGARGWWRHRTGTDARDWDDWLALARQDTDG